MNVLIAIVLCHKSLLVIYVMLRCLEENEKLFYVPLGEIILGNLYLRVQFLIMSRKVLENVSSKSLTSYIRTVVKDRDNILK